MADWKTLSSRIAYENPFIRVREDQAINPGGKQTVYGVVESKSPGVCIIPIDNEGNTYIIQQFRYTTQSLSWEAVGGRADEDTAEIGAKRELHEETGIIANQMTALGELELANGATTFRSTIFLAEDLTITNDELDQTDGILKLKKLPLNEVIDMIMSGEIQCAESIAAFFMAQEYLKRRT